MDNKELERIYNDTYRSVYWTAMSLLKNEADAEDIVQETFVTLIGSYDITINGDTLMMDLPEQPDVIYEYIRQ